MANRVNNDLGRLRSVEYDVRVWIHHKAADFVFVGDASAIGMISEHINDAL